MSHEVKYCFVLICYPSLVLDRSNDGRHLSFTVRVDEVILFVLGIVVNGECSNLSYSVLPTLSHLPVLVVGLSGGQCSSEIWSLDVI